MADTIETTQVQCPTCSGPAMLIYKAFRAWQGSQVIKTIPLDFQCAEGCAAPDRVVLARMIA